MVGRPVVGEDSRPVKRPKRPDLSGLHKTYAIGKSTVHTCWEVDMYEENMNEMREWNRQERSNRMDESVCLFFLFLAGSSLK